MSVRVTVVDEQTGDTETKRVPDGDYLLIVVEPCHLAHTQAHLNGTHVLTIKDYKHRARTSEEAAKATGP
jgi:hypothetical protein